MVRSNRWPLPALLVLLVSGAASAGPPASWPTVSPGGEPGHDDLLSQTDAIVAQVEAVRSLPRLHPVARGVLSRADITARIRAKLETDYTPGEIEADARMYKRLGLLPASADYKKLLLDLLAEQIAGFYDPDTKALYVADWIPMTTQRPALAHEIGHALVDQHFDLTRFDKPLTDDSDRELAESALVEGDGTYVMMEFVLQPLHVSLSTTPMSFDDMDRLIKAAGGSQPVFSAAPAFLQEQLLFPYVAGLEFVASIRRKSPWSVVDAVYAKPPASTAQVLHPEKYFANELPVEIPAPKSPLRPGTTLIKSDVLGELGLRLFLEPYTSKTVARNAAEGWAGDRLLDYGIAGRSPGPPRDEIVDRSIWETDADAAEAYDALRAGLAKLAGSVAVCGDSSTCTYRNRAGEAFGVERRGRDVVFTVGAAASEEAALRAAAWDDLVPAKAGEAKR